MEQYFNFYGAILRVFLSSNEDYLYKNKIYNLINNNNAEKQKTGLIDIVDDETYFKQKTGRMSKEYCMGAIEILYKSGLIEQTNLEKDPRKNKFILSKIGKKIAEFHLDMDEYNDNYFRLTESIEDKIPHIQDFSILERHDSMWKKNELQFYDKFRYDSLDLRDIFDRSFMNIVLLRYAKIINGQHFAHNDKLKIIFNDLVIKVIENRTRHILQKYKIFQQFGEARVYENRREINNERSSLTYETIFESGKEGKLPFYSEIRNYFNSRRIIPSKIEDEVQKMIMSYLKLLEYPKEFKIKEIDNFLNNKDNLMENYYQKYKNREDNGDSEYDFRQMVKLMFCSHEMFLKSIREYNKVN